MARAVLGERRDAGGALTLVELAIDPDVARTYKAPGQYVEVKVERGNGYFVLAGDVASAPWQLLVRNAGDAADAIVNGAIGSPIEISAALGLGFPIDAAIDRPLAVAVVGTAMAVARPILRRRIAEGVAASTYVFLGVRAPEDVPLADEVDAWCARGAHIVLCMSKAEVDAPHTVLPHAKRRAGYVQREVERRLETGELPRGTLVVAAGPKTMLAEMRALAEAHTGAVDVITNV